MIYKGEEINLIPTQAMADRARQGLEWREDFGRGGTRIGAIRANQLVKREELSPDVVKRMRSFHARHAVDLKVPKNQLGNESAEGYPGAGLIASMLWGYLEGRDFAERKVKEMEKIDERQRQEYSGFQVGDFVNWRTAKGMFLGRIVSIRTEGETQVGQETIEATIDDPVARIRVYVLMNGNYEETDRVVAFPLSRLKPAIEPQQRQIQNQAIKKALENKLEEHREKVGDDPRKRTTLRTLETVFERGVAAYKTNPSSVRPNIGNAESWAYARVNSFLYVLRNLRFRGGKHDTDLLPEAHPLSSKGEKNMDQLEIKQDEMGPHTMDPKSHVQEMDDGKFGVYHIDGNLVATFDEKEEAEQFAIDNHEDLMEMENAYLDDEEDERSDSTILYRSVKLRKDKKEKTRFNVAFVSEEPVLREFGYEIIDQERMDTSFLESGRAPVLFMHDAERVLGVVESVKRDGDLKSRAVIRLGTSTQLQRETLEQIRNGILSNISIGYSIRSMEEQDEKIEGRSVYRVATRIMEISVVSVPADTSVGVNRAEVIQEPSKQDVKTMENTEAVEQTNARDIEKALAERSKTNKEILALAARHNKRDLADEAIGRNTSLEEFRGILLEHIESKPLDSAAEPVQKPVEEKRTYSLLRALNAASRGDWSGAGFEAEMNQEVALKRGKQPQGFYIPDFAWRDYDPAMKRELTVGTNASGGFFAPSVQLADEFVTALRARMVLPGLGMRIMSGLNTKIQIPKISAGASAAFVAESGSVSDQTQTTAQITMVGRTLGARTDVSRLLLLESDPSIEQIVRDDLLAAVANKIEDVAIEGDASNEPTGITKTTGIGSVAIGTNGGAPTWAAVTDLVKEVEIDNAAINGDTLAFLTNPKVKSKMANTVRVSSTDSHMILNDPYNNLYGYDIGITTNVPSDLTKGSTSGSCSALIFGDFSQLMLGVFGGGPDVLIDPYTNSASGSVRIVVHQEVDVAVRHAQSFAACLDLTT